MVTVRHGVKVTLKWVWKLFDKNSKSRQLWNIYSGKVLRQRLVALVLLTDKIMSDQVDKTSFEKQSTSQCGRVVKVPVRHRQSGDPWFDPWGAQNCIFKFLASGAKQKTKNKKIIEWTEDWWINNRLDAMNPEQSHPSPLPLDILIRSPHPKYMTFYL